MLFFAPGGGNFYASHVFLCMYVYISMKAKNKLPTYANINLIYFLKGFNCWQFQLSRYQNSFHGSSKVKN